MVHQIDQSTSQPTQQHDWGAQVGHLTANWSSYIPKIRLLGWARSLHKLVTTLDYMPASRTLLSSEKILWRHHVTQSMTLLRFLPPSWHAQDSMWKWHLVSKLNFLTAWACPFQVHILGSRSCKALWWHISKDNLELQWPICNPPKQQEWSPKKHIENGGLYHWAPARDTYRCEVSNDFKKCWLF